MKFGRNETDFAIINDFLVINGNITSGLLDFQSKHPPSEKSLYCAPSSVNGKRTRGTFSFH